MQGRYKHFKGRMYEVVNTAKHTETGETLVIYHAENSTELWARPLEMFLDSVLVDGKNRPRFKPIPSANEKWLHGLRLNNIVGARDILDVWQQEGLDAQHTAFLMVDWSCPYCWIEIRPYNFTPRFLDKNGKFESFALPKDINAKALNNFVYGVCWDAMDALTREDYIEVESSKFRWMVKWPNPERHAQLVRDIKEGIENCERITMNENDHDYPKG